MSVCNASQCARSLIRNAVVAMALTLFSTPSISDFIEMLMGFVSVSVCPSLVTQVLNCQRVNVPKRAEDDVFLLNILVQMPQLLFYILFC